MNSKGRAGHIAIVIIVLYAWLNVAQHAATNFRVGTSISPLTKQLRQANNPHSYDVLLRDLKPLLPTEGTIGFFADAPRSCMETNVSIAARYYQSQYALCPLLLDYSTEHDYVVAVYDDFKPGMDLGTITNSHAPVTATPNGAVLFKRR